MRKKMQLSIRIHGCLSVGLWTLQASVLDFEAVVSEHTKYVQFTTELKSQLQQVWWSSQFGSLFVCSSETHIGFFRGLPAGTKFCTCGPERGSDGAWYTHVAAQWDPPWWTVEWCAWGCAQPSCEASGLVVAPQENEPSWMNSLTV